MKLLLFLFALVCGKTLQVLFTDRDYEQMTLELVRDLVKYQSPKNRNPIWVYTLYDEFGAQNKTWSFAALVDRVLPLALPRKKNYYQRIAPRFFVLLSLLNNTEFDGVLMIDSDVVVFRNVAARLESINSDLVVQQEVPCKKEHCVNAGVMWISTNNKPVGSLFETAIRFMKGLKLSDQDALQMAIDVQSSHRIMHTDDSFSPPHMWSRTDRYLRLHHLNMTLYPNGFVHQINQKLHKRVVHLVHVNWANSTGQKQRRLTEVRESMALVSSKEYPFLRTPLELDVVGVSTIIRKAWTFESLYNSHNLHDAMSGHDDEHPDDSSNLPCYAFPEMSSWCIDGNQRNRRWRWNWRHNKD
jgi:hypothetical protein